jgi:hypothetical protein
LASLCLVVAACAQTGWPTIEPRREFGDRVTCGVGPAFPVEQLNVRPDAENGTDAAATALRAFLSDPMRNPAPALNAGWRRVLSTSADVLFVSTESPATQWVYLWLSSSHVGQPVAGWYFRGSGDCQLEVYFGPDQRRAELYLDPANPISPTDRSVNLQLFELSCSGGQSPAGRVLEPLVVYETDRVLVAIPIRILPGSHDCLGVDAFPYALQLSEAIGSRQLFDAARVPPVPLAP